MAHTPKGLATVALLKTRVEQSQDHLGMFETFIADALVNITATDFVAADVKAVLHERTGLLLPTDAVQTLLNRFARKGYLQRAGGRYIRTPNTIADPGLTEARVAAEHAQRELAEELVTFLSHDAHLAFSLEDALLALGTFVSDNKVEILLRRSLPESPLDRSTQPRAVTKALARFITQRCLTSDSLRPAFDSLVEGILLHDALMLTDIRHASAKFAGLIVALDTPILFSAIGLAGAANGVAATEGLHLLRESGAFTIAFERTVAEMKRILRVYEDRLATSRGRLDLYPTDITRHVLTTNLTSGDIRVVSATLEERLRRVGVMVRTLPDRDRRYNLNEQTLANALVSARDQNADSPRVRHDIDCVAGVLVYRAGVESTSVERSRAIFATTSGLVIKTVQEWYFSEGETGMPPIIHHLALTSLAWLKKPAAAPNVKVHELAAICSAVLRPTRETWERVVESLRKMSDEGIITTDEAVAVVVSDLVEPILARLDDEVEPAADTIFDAIARVRDSFRFEANAEAQREIRSARTEAEAARAEATESVVRARAEAQLAQEAASIAIERKDLVLAAIRLRITRTSRVVSNVTYWAGVGLLVIAAALAIPGASDWLNPTGKLVSLLIALIAAGFGLWGSIRGGSLLSLRDAVEAFVTRRLQIRWLDAPLQRVEVQKQKEATRDSVA